MSPMFSVRSFILQAPYVRNPYRRGRSVREGRIAPYTVVQFRYRDEEEC